MNRAVILLCALLAPFLQACKEFHDPIESIDGAWYCEEHRSNGDIKSYYVNVELSMKDTMMYEAYNMFDLGAEFCVHLTLMDTVFHIVSDEGTGYNVRGHGRLYRTSPMRIEWEYGVVGPERNEPHMRATYIRD